MFNQLVYFNQSEHICSETISGHFRQFYHFVRPIKPGQTISASNHFVWLHHFNEIEQIGPFCLVIPFKLLGPFFVVRSVSASFILYGKTILSGLFFISQTICSCSSSPSFLHSPSSSSSASTCFSTASSKMLSIQEIFLEI